MADQRIADRYEDLGLLGRGGMGEVRRVRDTALNRVLAMKVIHPAIVGRPAVLARFLEEAQATAQLQHPNIVPVHDIGTLPDGRVWFTMKEIRGRTLRDVLRAMQAPGPDDQAWTLRRVMAVFHSVCQAVAYAHDRGVLHRDLKPDNVMVGPLGEVYVLDWGLAKVLEQASDDDLDSIRTDRSTSPDHATVMGSVAGTPAYMPPEQARGHVDQIDARSDVYALGAILYQILSGRPPYEGRTAREILDQVLAGPPRPVGRAAPAVTFALELEEEETGPPLPPVLVGACERAMARSPAGRYPSAFALGAVIEDWLDDAHRHEQALEVAERALGGVGEALALRAEALRLRERGDALLQGLEKWRPEEDKAPGWALQDEALAAERAAALEELRVEQGLQGALHIEPTLPEAHAALVDRYRERHAQAEAARDQEGQARAETLLASHASALPDDHPVRREAAAYLRGLGALSIVTDPPGAEVLLHRYEERARRLVAVFERSLGTTPLSAAPIPMGSWLCVLRSPDRPDVRYPIHVGRQAHWDGVAPGQQAPTPIHLPAAGTLAPDDVYVPAGWFASGGDPGVASLPARRLWCDAFVVQRFPVTNRQYVAFLDDLVARGREHEALAHAPRERAGAKGIEGALLYGRDPSGRFVLRPDTDGDVWLPDWPAFMLTWHDARAWLAWWAERSGRPWRLPGELEWEKAARGVDGRWFPWGDAFDPCRCLMTESHRGRQLPAVVDSYPSDASPYDVRGLAGNVQDWCLDVFDDGPLVQGDVVAPPDPGDASSEAYRVARGGAWSSSATATRSAGRTRRAPSFASWERGFRGLWRLG